MPDLVRRRPAVTTEGRSSRRPLGSFLAELRRRHVCKVGAGYGAFVLVVLAVVDAALPALPFRLPDWADTAIVTVTLAGLPVALILGRTFDITDGAVERTRSTEESPSPGGRLLRIAALALTLLVTGFLGWFLLIR